MTSFLGSQTKDLAGLDVSDRLKQVSVIVQF